MGIKTGTSHFVSIASAMGYYKAYGTDIDAVHDKIKAGEISIGEPKVKAGQTLTVDGDGRYHIIEADPGLSAADQAIIDLLWSSMKRDRDHKDRVQTGAGTKTKLGLAATVRRVLEAHGIGSNQYHCKNGHVLTCDICNDKAGHE